MVIVRTLLLLLLVTASSASTTEVPESASQLSLELDQSLDQFFEVRIYNQLSDEIAPFQVKNGNVDKVTLLVDYTSDEPPVQVEYYDGGVQASIGSGVIPTVPVKPTVAAPTDGERQDYNGASSLRSVSPLLHGLIAVLWMALAPRTLRNAPMLPMVVLLGFAVAVTCPCATVTVLLPQGCSGKVQAESSSSFLDLHVYCLNETCPENTVTISYVVNDAPADPFKEPALADTCYQLCPDAFFPFSALASYGFEYSKCESHGYSHWSQTDLVNFQGPLEGMNARIYSNIAPPPTAPPPSPDALPPSSSPPTTPPPPSASATTPATTSSEPESESGDGDEDDYGSGSGGWLDDTAAAETEITTAATTTIAATTTSAATTASAAATTSSSNAGPECAFWSCADCVVANQTLRTDTGAAPCSTVDHSAWTAVLQKYVVPNQVGTVPPPSVTYTAIDYAALRTDRVQFDEYLEVLASVPLDSLSAPEAKAMWINAYNAFTVGLILDNPATVTILALVDGSTAVWYRKLGNVGGVELSLDEIEHQILRKEFPDARVHAAVVCASISCPDIRNGAYAADQLEQQLDTQTTLWINNVGKGVVDTTTPTVLVSQIFDWYAVDFPDPIAFINQYLDVSTPQIDKDSQTVSATLNYNWVLNKPQA